MDFAKFLEQMADDSDDEETSSSPPSGLQGLMKSLAGDGVKGMLKKRVDDLEKMAGKLGLPKASRLDFNSNQGFANVYHHSRARIFKIGNRLTAGIVGDETIHKERGSQVPLPDEEKWDFQLGDAVRVKYPLKDFESIQRRTIGWRTGLVVIHGHVGFVTNVMSPYDSVINVLFPDIYQGCSLYAGVLEKVASTELTPYPSQWRVGDMVKPRNDQLVTPILQAGLKTLPPKLMGRKGRVTAIGPLHVEVTFDELRSVQIAPPMLVSSNDKSPITKPETPSINDFKVGEKVKVIQNMKALITNQKGKGGWNKEMSKLRDQELTIVHIQKDSTLNVHARHGRPWRITPDSVLKLEYDEVVPENDLKFLPGDLVKLKLPQNNLGLSFATHNAPMVFLEYLRGVAKIAYVDDDFDCYVMFNQSQKLLVVPQGLEKPSKAEVENYRRIEAQVKDLKANDDVHIDVGPPNYVRAILQNTDFDPHIKTALTNPGKLAGFIDYDTAVVEYQSGRRYKIAMKYLTVPDKFKAKKSKAVLDLDTAKTIRDTIFKAVRVLYYEDTLGDGEWSVDITSMMYGCPPFLQIRIQSMTAQLEAVVDWLRQCTDWKLENLYEEQFLVSGVDGFKNEIKLSIIFNDDESFGEKEAVVSTNETTIDEAGKVGNNARPFRGQHEGAQQQQPSLQHIRNVKDFKYICLYDSSLGQNVYFPYALDGPRRTPTIPLEAYQRGGYYSSIASPVGDSINN